MTMNSKTKALLGIYLLAAVFSGCSTEPILQEKTDNAEITFDVLFKRHGCEIGRFTDGGRNVYTTICPK